MAAAPPGAGPVARARRNHVGEKSGAAGQALVTELVSRDRRDPALADLIAADQHERDIAGRVIAYADPTGETAVRNVLRATR